MPQPTTSLIESFLQACNLTALSVEQLNNISQPFALQDRSSILKTLPNHKSPGINGFSCKFCRQLGDLISPHLLTNLNLAMSSGSLPPEILQVAIVTIPKTNKDPSITNNYRPLLFFNSDIEMFAKLLALGLVHILPSLIHQVGSVSGR